MTLKLFLIVGLAFTFCISPKVQAAADYYLSLGLSRNASLTDIKLAYRKAAMKYHPDRLVGATPDQVKIGEEKFKTIKQAFETLSDPEKRALYDHLSYGPFKMTENPTPTNINSKAAYSELLKSMKFCNSATNYVNLVSTLVASGKGELKKIVQNLVLDSTEHFSELEEREDVEGILAANIIALFSDDRFTEKFGLKLLNSSRSPEQFLKVMQSASIILIYGSDGDLEGVFRIAMNHFFDLNPSKDEVKALYKSIKSYTGLLSASILFGPYVFYRQTIVCRNIFR